jgi:hypothetical protein
MDETFIVQGALNLNSEVEDAIPRSLGFRTFEFLISAIRSPVSQPW